MHFRKYTTHCRLLIVHFSTLTSSTDLIAHCPYEESYECFFIREGFVTAHDNDGVLKITVPDTFSKQAGQFICQKEGQLLEVSCQFPPSGKTFVNLMNLSGLSITLEAHIHTPQAFGPTNELSNSKETQILVCYFFPTSSSCFFYSDVPIQLPKG